jgi:hypothetical protein
MLVFNLGFEHFLRQYVLSVQISQFLFPLDGVQLVIDCLVLFLFHVIIFHEGLQLSHTISYYCFFGLLALVDVLTQNSDVTILSRLKALLVMQELLMFRVLFMG